MRRGNVWSAAARVHGHHTTEWASPCEVQNSPAGTAAGLRCRAAVPGRPVSARAHHGVVNSMSTPRVATESTPAGREVAQQGLRKYREQDERRCCTCNGIWCCSSSQAAHQIARLQGRKAYISTPQRQEVPPRAMCSSSTPRSRQDKPDNTLGGPGKNANARGLHRVPRPGSLRWSCRPAAAARQTAGAGGRRSSGRPAGLSLSAGSQVGAQRG